MTYKAFLKDTGLADTRIWNINYAIEQLHIAVSQLDLTNLATLNKHCPELVAAANRYGKLEQGLATFEGTQPKFVNETITLKGYISTDETDEKALTG